MLAAREAPSAERPASSAVRRSLRRLYGTDEQVGRMRGGRMPAALRERYDGDLFVPLVDGRPTVIANFVTTLDGIVSFDPDGGTGGGEVSGFYEPDRFVMALLRAVSDAVLIGAGTLRADPRGRWIAASVHPSTAADTATWRASLGLAPNPTTVIVTASGEVDLGTRGLSDVDIPVLIATTEAGRGRLLRDGPPPPNIDIVVPSGDRVDPTALLATLGDRGFELVLSEGGPHLIAELVGAQLVDELFLTVAPQLAGRDALADRLALIEGRAFGVDEAPWAELVDVRVAGSHMFNRYRFGGSQP